MRDAAAAGRIGELTQHFIGAPTNRSHRHTVEVDCPEVLSRCLQDKADVAVLVPNCPVCHQTVSLTARYLEEHGIPTVVLGCAKDIVEHCGVPRFVFSDFPLGNAAGKPHDEASQAATLELGLPAAGKRVRAAHHPAVAAALGCRRGVEAGLPEPRADRGGGAGAAQAGVPAAEGDRQGPAGDRRRDHGGRAALRGHPHPRLHPGAGGALRQLPALPAGRRGHQGGAAGGRGHAPHAAVPRMGRARHGAGLAGGERQQAQPDARPAEPGGAGDREAPGAGRRCGDGEFPPRGDGPAGAGLRGSRGHQSEADLVQRLRLRPDRAGPERGGVRRADPGDVRASWR